MRKLKATEMGRMNPDQYRASAKMPLAIILDDVRSMYNIGSIFRTADAFRIQAIHLCGITAQPPHPEIHKTALGAEHTVAWHYHPTALQAVTTLKQQGYTIYSVEQCQGSTMLQDLEVKAPPSSKYAIVLGNEVKGVHQEVIDASHGCIEIPQFGTKHSLNVSTAAGIVIWEIAKHLLIP